MGVFPKLCLFSLSVVGKRVMQFKVCSCPKRDKGKEESQLNETKVNKHGTKRKREGNVSNFSPVYDIHHNYFFQNIACQAVLAKRSSKLL